MSSIRSDGRADAIVAVQHVFKSVTDSTGTLDILQDIDFTLGARETAAIVGASGSGKSTLLSIVAGLDTPTRGTVKLAGEDLFAIDEDERAAKELDLVGLGERMNHYPAQLSGGEQQRVALARALAPNPSLLFADEPTGNLDETTGRSIIDLLFAGHAERNTTLVLVTHDPVLARRCDRVVRLRSGRIDAESREIMTA